MSKYKRQSILESSKLLIRQGQVRGEHPEYVFVRRGRPIAAINDSGWKTARRAVGLVQVRVHDLKHTFGRRLRAAGVAFETRKVLLGHKNGEITTHYSAPELGELIAAVEKITPEKSGKTPALTLLRVGATT